MSSLQTLTAEMINTRDGERPGLTRSGRVRAFDEENRCVELAFSSETPVLRWFGEEILDHAPGAMDTSRLDDGAPFLVGHNPEDHVGVVEMVETGADRKGRARVRLGKSARAQEILDDIRDGIRQHVSVGYTVDDVEVQKRAGQPDLVTVRRWQPFEISLVSIPADPSVGVGRSMEKPPQDFRPRAAETDDNNTHVRIGAGMEKTTDTVEAKVMTAEDPVQAERARAAAIIDLGRQYKAEALASQAVTGNRSVDAFKDDLLKHIASGSSPALDVRSIPTVGLTDKECRSFSIIRAIRALAEPADPDIREEASFELEVSRAAARAMGKKPRGIIIPHEVLERALNTSKDGAAPGNTGGYLVATDYMAQSFVQILRNRTVAMKLGSPMTGLVGNVEIPVQVSGTAGYWLKESQNAPETVPSYSSKTLTPRTVGALVPITRRQLMQSSLDVEAKVRADLAAALGGTIDKAVFYGTGDEAPRGLSRLDGINVVRPATPGKPTYDELVEMESVIAAANADTPEMAYVLSSRTKGWLKTAQKFEGTNGAPIWEPGDTVNGYRAETTNQVDPNDIFFGDFSELIIGLWGGLEITVDTATNSASGGIRVIAFQDCDFLACRPESFCLAR
ncbi:phage major capsid protein [Haematospirillum jordaniae]|uniref:phage major capsid protein n=1 Tax=Haematospirillum jordaniae TaxID=1549855 RepID=UPI001432E52A|nr:phage major capsid protein [Haematospirillum jordaniae]NKD93154.1 phage major capsid protein [Haematospirillum jordaniae]